MVVADTYRSTLDLALRLHPGTQQAIIVVGGPADRSRALEATARDELKEVERESRSPTSPASRRPS